mmetsp:Transcript_6117/g.5263  ORF Transcript_6117/g.5263 Transcript_6117/m.5263 type:complete len:116 (+) Transcript_6117:1446-1793(+)
MQTQIEEGDSQYSQSINLNKRILCNYSEVRNEKDLLSSTISQREIALSPPLNSNPSLKRKSKVNISKLTQRNQRFKYNIMSPKLNKGRPELSVGRRFVGSPSDRQLKVLPKLSRN